MRFSPHQKEPEEVISPLDENTSFLFDLRWARIRGWWEGPWCMGGDFNEILSPSERAKGGNFSPSMRCFAEIVNDLGLTDLLL